MAPTIAELQGKHVHLLGIGGIGVSALARLLKARGVTVSGCDVRPSSLIDGLREEGITVDIGHSPSHVDGSDVVVYSTAVPQGNPELAYAQEANRPLLHRSHLLGAILGDFTSIGITGTNGKGTVSSMLTWILEWAGLAPSFYIGALCPNLGTNARIGTGPHLVAELDESDGSLLNTAPGIALLNNLELDHLNYYRDFDHAVEVITRFFQGLPQGAKAFFHLDDPGAWRVATSLRDLELISFGRHPEADYRYQLMQVSHRDSRFTMEGPGGPLGEFTLQVPGAYNIENAVAAISVALELGVTPAKAREAMAGYRGLINRYTLLEAAGRSVIKDYMSHPMGIRKVLETARIGCAGRLWAVFKPYRYTMINYHADNYSDAFRSADEIILTEMWEGGEEPIPGVDTQWLADKMRASGLSVTYLPDMNQIPGFLLEHQKAGDSSVFFGGNDLFELAESLVERFQEASHV